MKIFRNIKIKKSILHLLNLTTYQKQIEEKKIDKLHLH
jgi:hypothetical protein